MVLIACVLRVWDLAEQSSGPPPVAEGEHRVARVVDGDTLVLDTGVRVRLQGVDSPEAARDGLPAEPWADDATDFARRFVDQAGGVVRLTLTDERLDRYGRTLAFVWDGQRCLNELLVSEGLAQARLDYRFTGTMRRRLADAQRDAQDRAVGLWSRPPTPQPTDAQDAL